MALTNKYTAYYKTIKVIYSCKTTQQCFVAKNMIYNFNKLYKSEILYDSLINKWNRHFMIV